jgi:uncharacterized membrane protein
MEHRPKITIRPNRADKVVEGLSYAFLAATFVQALYAYFTLPDTVPVHFNIKGEADGYGSKISILPLPLISVISFVGMTILNRYPWIFNYPVKITPENALKQYTSAVRLIRWLKLSVLLIFFLITAGMSYSAREGSFIMGTLMLPLILVIATLPLLIYLIEAFRKPQKPLKS